MSLPVTRPAGPALVVGNPTSRVQTSAVLEQLGFTCGGADDPYAAMAELARPQAAYKALILSLQSVYREEIELIPVVKRRFPLLEIWLADTDGRQSTLAEAMALGADGLMSDEGLHRLAAARTESNTHAAPPAQTNGAGKTAPPRNGEPLLVTPPADHLRNDPHPPASRSGKKRRHRAPVPVDEPADEYGLGEAILTAEELRALLQEPAVPAQDEK